MNKPSHRRLEEVSRTSKAIHKTSTRLRKAKICPCRCAGARFHHVRFQTATAPISLQRRGWSSPVGFAHTFAQPALSYGNVTDHLVKRGCALDGLERTFTFAIIRSDSCSIGNIRASPCYCAFPKDAKFVPVLFAFDTCTFNFPLSTSARRIHNAKLVSMRKICASQPTSHSVPRFWLNTDDNGLSRKPSLCPAALSVHD